MSKVKKKKKKKKLGLGARHRGIVLLKKKVGRPRGQSIASSDRAPALAAYPGGGPVSRGDRYALLGPTFTPTAREVVKLLTAP